MNTDSISSSSSPFVTHCRTKLRLAIRRTLAGPAGLWVLLVLTGAGQLWGDEPPTNGSPMAAKATMPGNSVMEKAAANATNGVKMANLDNNYHLAIGDQISFQITQDNDEARLFVVNDSGDIDFPYVGRMAVAGRTCQEIAGVLKTNLEKTYYYHATVVIAVDSMTKSRGKVYLAGAVRTSGAMDIPSDEVLTVSKAIFRAGGFAEFADERNVRVTRKAVIAGGKGKMYVVDVKDLVEKGQVEADLQLQAGDLVYIPERLVRLY